jgi:hypothetical protein
LSDARTFRDWGSGCPNTQFDDCFRPSYVDDGSDNIVIAERDEKFLAFADPVFRTIRNCDGVTVYASSPLSWARRVLAGRHHTTLNDQKVYFFSIDTRTVRKNTFSGPIATDALDTAEQILFGRSRAITISSVSLSVIAFLLVGISSVWWTKLGCILSGGSGILLAMAIPIVAVFLLAFENDGYVSCCLILVAQVYVFDIFLIWDSAFPTGPQTTLGILVVEPLTAGIEYALLFGTPTYVVARIARYVVDHYKDTR